MRTRLLILGACVVSSTTAPAPIAIAQTAASNPPLEYAGVYISSPDEDYFTPCGIEGTGDTWSLRFRDDEPHAPFLKKVTAIRGYAPLTHFIRVRGRLGPPGRYNVGFQTRELAVDSVLDVKESLEPCPGFGVPAAWSRLPARFRNLKGMALSTDRRVAALVDIDGRISIWSTETGKLVRKLGTVPKGNVAAASYGPMTFSDDGKLLAIGSNDGVVRVWRPRDGKRVFLLKLKDSAAVAQEMDTIPPRADAPAWKPPPPPNSYTPARQIVFNKRGTMLMTSSLFASSIWSMKTGQKLAEFNLGNDFRRKTFFTPDDGLLMTADSGRMTIRSFIDAQPVTRPGTRASGAEHVTMSPDGRVIAVSSWADSLYLWSIAEGPGRALHVPGFVTGEMAFSPDGNTIAIAAGSSGLYLYDTRTGAPIRSFYNFAGPVSRAWFTADGKSIVTLSTFDDRLRIVYVDPTARPAAQSMFDDSLTAKLPLGPPPSTTPRTIGGIVTGPGPNPRAIPGAEVTISNGDAPDSVIARRTTSAGGYFSFAGIRFRHVLLRVQKPGFATGVRYIHVNRWEDDGPWGIELTPETRPAESGGG